jgi:hypothetical protein
MTSTDRSHYVAERLGNEPIRHEDLGFSAHPRLSLYFDYRERQIHIAH